VAEAGIWERYAVAAAEYDERLSVDLRDYVRILRKSWASILAFVVIGVGAGVGLTLATTKVYQADVQMFAATPGGDSSGVNQANIYAQQVVQSLTAAATSPRVTVPVVKQHKLAITANQLAGKITADAPLNKVLINLHVTDTNPQNAARLANFVANEFTTVAANLLQTDAGGKSVVKLTVIQPAEVPSAPITPNKILNIGLGLVVGLLIGVGVAVLREVLDNTVNGPSDFEDLGVAVLGLVPFDKRTPRSPIAFRSDPHSARSEAYRQLRTNLQFVDVDNPPRIIAVTSAVPGEGKTTTAINLAAALAEAGARVCLVEADLRRPSVAKVLGLVGDVGFTTVVIGKAPIETVLQNAGRNLAVLTSGPIPPNPSELLISQHARQVIAELARNVDFTIIDTPPLLPVTDGAELATMADATLLVHRASKTTRDQAMRSIQALDKVGKRPVGVILNMLTRGAGKYDGEYAYYTAAYRPDRADGRRGAHHVDPAVPGTPADVEDSGTDLLTDPADTTPTGPFGGAAGSPRRG
jgi:capsular exopolysaccharide synthesis family protein